MSKHKPRGGERKEYEHDAVHEPSPVSNHVDVSSCETDLIRRAVEEDDTVALESFFSLYEGLLCRLAHTYESSLLPFADAYQVAAVGLMKALRGFDPGRGSTFKSYAYPHVKGELMKFYRDNAEMIRLPRRVWKLKNAVRKAQEKSIQETGELPSLPRLAELSGLVEEEIREAGMADDFLAPISIEAPVYSDGDFRLGSILGSVDPHIEEIEDCMMLDDAVERLPEALQRVVELRMNSGKTQVSVAREMNMSQIQVSRLQKRACSMIREYIFHGDSGVAFADS